MSYANKLHIILNPASAGGRTARSAPSILELIEQQIGADYSLCTTERSSDATKSAAEAVRNGCEKFLVVGGDGTINETINGLLLPGIEAARRCTLGIMSSGSGEGLARSLSLPDSIEEKLSVGLHGDPEAIDIAKVSYIDSHGILSSRFFVNECQIGIGAEVVRRTTRQGKRVGGLIAYGLRTLSLICHSQSPLMRIVVDGKQQIVNEVLGVAIGNGAITAGGMRLTPEAKLNDGLLDILVIKEQTRLRRLHNFSLIYSGHHVHRSGFTYERGTAMTIEADTTVGLAADGEFLGRLPCSIEIVPSVLHILCPHRTPQGEA